MYVYMYRDVFWLTVGRSMILDIDIDIDKDICMNIDRETERAYVWGDLDGR